MRAVLMAAVLLAVAQMPASAQRITVKRNKPEREAWFQTLGFGMFIHWSIDVQLGAIISHSAAVGSKDYLNRYFHELPKTFNPKRFDPDEWATLAQLAGMKYMVFTAKHHNGFCMWDTATTDFNIMNTPYGRDALAEIITAFRRRGIAIGLYFSPDDYHVMYEQGYPPSRNTRESESTENPELWGVNRRQLKELLTNYGKIDILFLDEKSDWVNTLVADYSWDIDPDLIITRGGMATPEQHLPDKPIPGPWEACFTIGQHWQYVAGEPYKDATELIDLLIQTRARGGNLLLNVGPKANGEIPERQEARLREIALWMFANHESVENVEPWDPVREGNIWFTKAKGRNIVYAFLPGENWKWMERKAFVLRSVKGNEQTRVSVLGQNQQVMEYQVEKDPKIYDIPRPEGLYVNAVKAQRLNKTWDNPIVLRMENVSSRVVAGPAPR